NKRVLKNYIYNTAYQVLVIIVPLITTPYISRILHSDGVGVYSYTYTIAFAYSLFAGLGVNSYGQREIAYNQGSKEKMSSVFWELVILRTVMTLITVCLYIMLVVSYRKYSRYLVEQIFIIVAVLFDISWFFQGIENFKIVVIRNLIVKIVSVVLIFLLVKEEKDIDIYILINSLSILLSNIFFFINLPKYVDFVDLKKVNILRHMKGTIQFFIPLIATQIYSQLDKIMLGVLLNDTMENGYYEQARKITAIIVAIVTSLNNVLLSRISYLFINNEIEEIKRCFEESFKVMLFILIPILPGMFIMSDNFVIWFFGEEFIKVALLMKLSCILLVFMCLGNFIGVQFLAPTKKQNKMTFAYVTAAIVNFVFNIILIPKWKSEGALVASIVAESVSCGIQWFYLLNSKFRFKILSGIYKYLIAAGIMAFSIVGIKTFLDVKGMGQTIIEFAVGILVYISVLIVCKEKNVMIIISHLSVNFQKKFHLNKIKRIKN
ncbi:flippase, partial [Ruminococcus sp. AF13-37]